MNWGVQVANISGLQTIPNLLNSCEIEKTVCRKKFCTKSLAVMVIMHLDEAYKDLNFYTTVDEKRVDILDTDLVPKQLKQKIQKTKKISVAH